MHSFIHAFIHSFIHSCIHAFIHSFLQSPWRSCSGRRTYFDKFVSQHLSGAGSSPAGTVGRDLNLQKLDYQYLTTSVAVVLVAR